MKRLAAHHAIVPSRFPVQVSHQTQKPPAEFLPAYPEYDKALSWRSEVMQIIEPAARIPGRAGLGNPAREFPARNEGTSTHRTAARIHRI